MADHSPDLPGTEALLTSEVFDNCVITPFTRACVTAATHEQVW